MAKAPTPAVILPLLATAAAMGCFQLGAAAAKSLFPFVGPLGTAVIRLALGAFILLLLTRPWRSWPKGAPIFAVLGLGASMAGAITFFYLAIDRLPLGVVLPIQFLGPLAVAILGSKRAWDLIWVGVAATGVWCLVGSNADWTAIKLEGLTFALGAALCWAGYILFGRAAGGIFGTATAAISASLATLFVLPMGVFAGDVLSLPGPMLPWALLVALLSTVIPFSLELYALPRIPTRTFSVFTSLEPAFAVLSGMAFLKESLASVQIAGVLLVIVASAGAAWSSQDAEPT